MSGAYASRLGIVAAAMWLVAGPCSAQEGPDLYTCRVIVTGTDLRERPAGLERCVRAVIVRLTAMPRLATDRRVDAIALRAADFIEDIVYLDRMTDLPRHDEQGTRDRPFDLVVHVAPAKLRAALALAGLRPWSGRPTLLARVTVSKEGERFMLTADGLAGERQRRALLAAGETYGMRVALLTEQQAAASRVDGAALAALADCQGGVAMLDGTLTWSETDFGWNAEWHLARDGSSPVWAIRGVSFDEAFRAGVGGAAERLRPDPGP